MHTGNSWHFKLARQMMKYMYMYKNHVQLTKSAPPFTFSIITEITAYFHGFGVGCWEILFTESCFTEYLQLLLN